MNFIYMSKDLLANARVVVAVAVDPELQAALQNAQK
ncbi:hypothetical protein ABID27_000678 [Streptococcus gallinaceus]|uniref:Uncharacterized protein n=1 Tax=Streptococcus gallinaceus TaxID=165758 RepID=A0ABV2JJG5_9STRE